MVLRNQKSKESRRDERVATVLPVKVGAEIGLTRDVSATGVYFEVASGLEIGSEIEFSVELDAGSEKMFAQKVVLSCRGKIVRTEAHGKRTGVAVKIIESALERVADSGDADSN